MSVLRPLDKLPVPNVATILLVGTDEKQLEQLAEAMLKESKSFKIQIHLAPSLPLPSDSSHLRPRIDLIVFLFSLQSKKSFSSVEASLAHVDASFFLGKVCFLATGARREDRCSVHMSTGEKLAFTYNSPLLFCNLESSGERTVTAQRLMRVLQVSAGFVPGVSTLSLTSMLKRTGSASWEEW
ncbi:centromere protein M [Ornithorhynchus anatinus]|uniref:centromere protein M n=1 Tax=Ornithorhynchus anatinus TaxID=9258 RepID=UPI0010A7D370|nr:centromere protein M [Ornithorhynchus anatinus]